MDCFIVMLRHGMDDIPLLVTADRAEAIAFAESVEPNDGENERNILSIDCSSPICTAVYAMKNGRLAAIVRVKDFTL